MLKKNKWKKEKTGYYLVPKGTTLTYSGYLDSSSHVGKWEINNDGVYLTMTYDEVRYGDYDAYLKEI